MILSGQTKFRTGRFTGVLLLLAAIAVLPLAAVVRADDKTEKKSFDERLRRLEQLVEELVHSGQERKLRDASLKAGQDKNAAVVEFGDFDKDGNLDYRFRKGLPKDMLMFVVADWCPKCKTLRPMIEKLRWAGVKTAVIDVTHQTDAIKALGLKEIPATLVWRDGRVASRHEGLEWVAQELESASLKAAEVRVAKRHDDTLRNAQLALMHNELMRNEEQLKIMHSKVKQLTAEIFEWQILIEDHRRLGESLRVKAKNIGGDKSTTRK